MDSKKKSHQSKKEIPDIITEDFMKYNPPGRYKVHYGPSCTCSNNSFISKSSKEVNLRNHLVVMAAKLNTKNPRGHPPIFAFVKKEIIKDCHNKEYLLQCEKELYETIIPESESTTKNNKKYYITCAACLLHQVPNAFLGIHSDNYSVLKQVVKDGYHNKQEKAVSTLAKDHAEFLPIISTKLLREMFFCVLKMRASKKRMKSTSEKNKKEDIALEMEQDKEERIKITSELFSILKEQEIPVTHKIIDSSFSDDSAEFIFELGHHLEASISILDREGGAKDNITVDNSRRNYFRENMYWIVMMNKKKSGNTWVFDLPGGKRHLGENPIDCLKRETEEETSIILNIVSEDKESKNCCDCNNNEEEIKWFVTDKKSSKDTPENVYYFLKPEIQPEELHISLKSLSIK